MKVYRYSFIKIFLEYWFLFIVPIIIGWYPVQEMVADHGLLKQLFSGQQILPLVLTIIFIILYFIPLTAISVLLNTKLIISETGVRLKNFLKEKHIRWEDIETIDRKHFYPIIRELKPNDIEIKDRSKKVIRIYRFLRSFEEAKKDIERYLKRKIDEVTAYKSYKGGGYNIHKKISLLIITLMAINWILIFILYFFKYKPKIIIVYTCIPFLAIALYALYFERKSCIELSITNIGLIYESAKRYGLRFKRFRSSIPWSSINSVKIIDNKKGPLKIETSDGNYFFWNSVNSDLNFKILDEINRRSVKES